MEQAAEAAREEPKVREVRLRFTGERLAVAHPYIGTITIDHLTSPHIIAGIRACDDIGKTKNWYGANIEEVSD
ncbi:MAG TPA: hypothetical protein PK225_12010 [Azonexus sp.]|nr:hypothetical protein [Azonexus sp.]